jgi:hypothetical protein
MSGKKKLSHKIHDYDATKPWFYSFYGHEAGWAKKMTRRKNRHDAKANIRRGRDDLASDRVPSSQGWISW